MGSSHSRDHTCVSSTGRWILYHGATREAREKRKKVEITEWVPSRKYIQGSRGIMAGAATLLAYGIHSLDRMGLISKKSQCEVT